MKRNNKGSISLYVLIACTFFVVVLMSKYVSSVNKSKAIEEEVKQIQKNYENFEKNEFDEGDNDRVLISSIVLEPNEKILDIGETFQLNITKVPENATERVKWTSDNNTVATVSGSGMVIAQNIGEATIRAEGTNITTSSASKPFDGSALISSRIDIEGIINNEVTGYTTGSRTEVGASENTYVLEFKTGKEKNYNVIENLGTLTVNEATAPTPDYNEELGAIEININLLAVDENFELTNSSDLINSAIESEKFNVGIFIDKNGTIPASEDYNRKIKFENSNNETIIYDNIPEGTYYIFALDEDGNPINVSSSWTGNTNYKLYYNFGTDMNETNSVIVKNKSKQQVILNYVIANISDGY